MGREMKAKRTSSLRSTDLTTEQFFYDADGRLSDVTGNSVTKKELGE